MIQEPKGKFKNYHNTLTKHTWKFVCFQIIHCWTVIKILTAVQQMLIKMNKQDICLCYNTSKHILNAKTGFFIYSPAVWDIIIRSVTSNDENENKYKHTRWEESQARTEAGDQTRCCSAINPQIKQLLTLDMINISS